jgi:hypothetical protein
MDEAHFWEIVDAARAAGGLKFPGRIAALREKLGAMTPQEIQEFQNHYDEQIRRSYRWDLVCAASLINGSCTDDEFRYFCDWLISEGASTFMAALRHPDSLADLPRLEELATLEEFGAVAYKLYEARTGQELERDFSTELASPAGIEWDEAELPTRLPQLATKYPRK